MDNSPHVPFFSPIIEKLQEDGFTVKKSIRNYSQTVGLAQIYGLKYKVIGKHYGKHKLLKLFGLFYRAIQLLPFALKHKPIMAVSHGSRSQMLIAHFLKIPIVLFLDYEFVQILPTIKPRLAFFPNVVTEKTLSKFHFPTKTYPGIKEFIYVPSFIPDASLQNEYNFKDFITVIIRPPAHEAHYHNEESEKLFDEVMNKIINCENTQAIILPRDKKQKKMVYNKYRQYFDNEKLKIPELVVDALSLMWYSDIVISGGGTMNREAAALGIPVYTIFKGKIGDVDRYLSDTNRLTIISSVDEIKDKLKLEKRHKPAKLDNLNSLALHSITEDLKNLVLELSEHNSGKKKINNYEHKLQPNKRHKHQ